MDYHKIYHPKQFSFSQSCVDGCLDFGFYQCQAALTQYGAHVFHFELDGDRWGERQGLNTLFTPSSSQSAQQDLYDCSLSADGKLEICKQSETILSAQEHGSIGIAGNRWMIEFDYHQDFVFYGMGEKCGSLEKTGKRTKFWNTDVWADFPYDQIRNAQTDPMYVSIPYLIIRCRDTWVGILIDNPYDTFISAGGEIGAIANQQGVTADTRLYFGSAQGKPSVYFIVADSLADLTKQYQQLVGTTPLPPLWSLGHHQCRWGYGSAEDLAEVKRGMEMYDIPNSAVWLDIDYMDEYRVFTWSPELWSGDTKAQLAELQADGQRVIPILDPGVKNDPGYTVYQSGHEANIWCSNEDGIPYVGYVWPGETLFPDYTLPEGQQWWRDQVADFASIGIQAAWCDMNDPSVGPVELDTMCFRRGSWPHAVGHNQYGAQMAQATRAGFEQAYPNQRPFLLSRSGYTGCQQHTALWTGDNISNQHYLEGSIPCTLNLALSGVPFNGPDVPGFGEDASEKFALCWYQAGFLFPFLRNHSLKHTRSQEPYSFCQEIRSHIAHFIRLRYRLLPYIYQLWIKHEQEGDAIVRPLFYDFDQADVYHEQTSFLLGPDLLHAPYFNDNTRSVILPGGDQQEWFDLRQGNWLSGGQYDIHCSMEETPLYVRSGAIIAMQDHEPRDHHVDLAHVDLHCFLRPGQRRQYRYYADDGETLDYQQGARSSLDLDIEHRADHYLIHSMSSTQGWKRIQPRLQLYDNVPVSIDGQQLEGSPSNWRASGTQLQTQVVPLSDMS